MNRWCPVVSGMNLHVHRLIVAPRVVTLGNPTMRQLAIRTIQRLVEVPNQQYVVGYQVISFVLQCRHGDDLFGLLTATTPDGGQYAVAFPQLKEGRLDVGHTLGASDVVKHFVDNHPLLHTLVLTQIKIERSLLSSLGSLQLMKFSLATMTDPFTVVYPRLRGLVLEKCTLDETTMLSIPFAMPNLQQLVFNSNGHPSTAVIQHIIKGCRKLVFVRIDYRDFGLEQAWY